MEIRLIFFKEIVGVISLKKGLTYLYEKHFVLGRKNHEEDFSSLK